MTRFTTCSCTTGLHDDEKAATRSHEREEFAQIIARHTCRHVVTVEQLGTQP